MKKLHPTVKLGFALAGACALLIAMAARPSVQGKAGNELAAARISVSVVIDVGRKSRNCAGFGICRITLTASAASKRAVKGEISTGDDGKLSLTLLGKAPDEGRTLILDEDVPLPAEVARKLGLKSATLLRGEYAFNAGKTTLSARLVK